MVNPIIANLIKNSIKNTLNKYNTDQIGGSADKKTEVYVVLFMIILTVITIIPFAVIENAIQSKFDKNDPNELNDFKEVTETAYYSTIAIYGVLMIIFIIIFSKLRKDKEDGLKILFTISLLFMIPLIIGSYIAKLKKSDKFLLFSEYIGVKGYTGKEIGYGMMTNIFFGFIDNFGLFFGMDAIDTYLANVSKIDELTLGGIGNTYSDFIGAFVGNAVGDLTLTLANVDKTPIISEIIGIVLGCILGLLSGKFIKKFSSKDKKSGKDKKYDTD